MRAKSTYERYTPKNEKLKVIAMKVRSISWEVFINM
jgi:hypothetical protein